MYTIQRYAVTESAQVQKYKLSHSNVVRYAVEVHIRGGLSQVAESHFHLCFSFTRSSLKGQGAYEVKR